MAACSQEVPITSTLSLINRHALYFSNRLLTRSIMQSRTGSIPMKIRTAAFLAVLLGSFSIMAGTALAQNLQNGAVRGTVFDTSHAAVATAKLTLINPSTGIRRELSVESDGGYV